MNHEHSSILNYDYIDDGIFAGTNQCCVTALSDLLKKEGITADISLEGEQVDQPFGVEVYVWVPIPDHTTPTNDQLEFTLTTLVKLVDQKKKIYVHCKNGHGRTSTILTAYFMQARGLTRDKAIELIKSKRPTIHLQDSQLSFLDEFQKTLLKNAYESY